MRKPPNTSAMDPMRHLAMMTAKGANAAIEDDERTGAESLRASEVLPVVVRGLDHQNEYDPRPSAINDAPFVALGFTFGDPFPDDPLFRPATLPPGWTKRPGDNPSFWTVIVDETGTERASIFYKAAFYDRHAVLHVRVPESDR